MMREALIDLGAITKNVIALRSAVGDTATMVIVKANAYGHGAVPVARAALDAGVEWLGTADLDEACALRAAGIQAPVLAWLHDPEQDFTEAIAANIDLGVSYLTQLDRVAAASGIGQVHLKLDTGLGRNGAAPADWPELFEQAAAHQRAGRIIVRGILSHLAGAGVEGDVQQIALFDTGLAAAASCGLTPEFIHIASSGAALRQPSSRFTLVRLGIAAYGLSPQHDLDAPALGLTPAMQLSAAIVSVKRVAAGTGVSYGHDYVAAADTTLALVPLGYADGVPRSASGRGPISINGVTYPVAGRVAMDQCVVDVGDAAVGLGDRAVLFGDPSTGVPSVDQWAQAAGTINYEIVTRIGPRVTYRYRS
ncbi:MAG: alanine racemase [Rhodoglobus sp.]